MKILVTGGTGFIGSHTVVELLEIGHEVVIIDNLSNSNACVLSRIFEITGRNVEFYNVDIRNYDDMDEVFQKHTFDCCIHFAGLKAVGESVIKPILYYDNNDEEDFYDDDFKFPQKTIIGNGAYGCSCRCYHYCGYPRHCSSYKYLYHFLIN